MHNILQASPEAQAAWVAASIDCDGWVSIQRARHKDGHDRYQCITGVTNQSREYHELLANVCGVPERIGINGQIGRDDRLIQTRRICYQAQWSSAPHIIRILTLALPYLIIKKQRAEWVLEFAISRIGPNGKVARRWQPYTPRAIELYWLVKQANHGHK